jgi:hypothetical protein
MKKIVLLALALNILSCSSQIDEQSLGRSLAGVLENTEIARAEAEIIEGNWLVEAITKDGYFFIPETALVDSVKAVVRPFYHPDKKLKNKRMFEVSWHPGCLDGGYNITITPEQIFFSTSHDNPNPPKLHWVQNITQDLYAEIAKSFKTNAPTDFEDYSEYSAELYSFLDKNAIGSLPNHPQPTEGQMKFACQNYDSLNMEQIKKVYAVLNSMIAKEKSKIVVPTQEEMDEIIPKFFGSSKKDLQERVRNHEKYFR